MAKKRAVKGNEVNSGQKRFDVAKCDIKAKPGRPDGTCLVA